ncbi:MAG: glycosyl hydrolase family 65 protein [Candidatus Dormibacteria bacterium]
MSDRAGDATPVRSVIEDLCAAAFDVVVITGTHVANVDGQLRARPRGPGRLLLCVNRGSEVFECGAQGPVALHRREATPDENAQLDRAAALTVERLADRGLTATIVAQRLNRRKVDIIPLPEWADPPKARIAELVAAVEARVRAAGISSLAEVVAIAEHASSDAGLPHPRISSDGKYVEIGLTDKADAARWAFGELWEHGITAADVMVAGDEFGQLGGLPGSDSLILVAESEGAVAFTVGAEPFGQPAGVLALPGGPRRALAVLADQLRRRRAGEPPQPRPASTWRVIVDGLGDAGERARASVLTVADGRIGSIGVPVLAHPDSPPRTLAAGFYEGDGSGERLQPLPGWNQLATPVPAGAHLTRVLDLRTGTLAHEVHSGDDRLSAVAFSALHDPGCAVLWASGASRLIGAPAAGVDTMVTTSHGGAMSVRTTDTRRDDGGHTVVERVAVFTPGDAREAERRNRAARGQGVGALHRAHRETWARRWRDADIAITGDPGLQRDVRYSLFQLMGAVATSGEAALGARGLSGNGYNGHVFWDSDVFVVPFLAATCPAAARAMLEYRVRRIDAAIDQAREQGLRGAKFPWESATTGREITPAAVLGPRGEHVVVRNGEMEDHIVADVAWAACRYDDWTADDAFRRGPLQRLLVETARYWASRVVRDGDGSAHIRHVIGPDEYHEDVDDNAFTNVMARWNLRTAMSRAGPQCDASEVRSWATLADQLVDGFDTTSRVYEQFSGFSDLVPYALRETFGAGPIAADSVLGFDRVRTLQIVKQADVLMLHFMVPDEVPAGSLVPNLDRYLPITAHGSSLSPAVCASLLARAGRHPQALDLLRYSAALDLNGESPTTADGLHVATMGGTWMAMVEGFAGIRADGDGLRVVPRLPDGWQELTVRVVFRGVRVRVTIHGDVVDVVTDRPLRVLVGEGADERAVVTV